MRRGQIKQAHNANTYSIGPLWNTRSGVLANRGDDLWGVGGGLPPGYSNTCSNNVSFLLVSAAGSISRLCRMSFVG